MHLTIVPVLGQSIHFILIKAVLLYFNFCLFILKSVVSFQVTYMNSLFKEARAKYEQLLLKNSNITRVLRSLFSGENVAFSFSNISHDSSSFNNNTASSMFRNAVQPSSIFSQNNTPFGQNNATSIFAQNTTSDPARSIFAQANQSQSSVQNLNAFGIQDQNNQMNVQSNVFGPQTDSTAKSIFAQASHNNFTAPTQNASNAASLFASAAQSAFNQPQSSPFSNNQAQSSNIFQRQETHNPASGFTMSQNVAQQANTDDIIVYSKMEDLSTDDIEAYNCADFKMGFVPELPPPHSLCF